MDGYLKPNFRNERKELHALDLDDCDFVPDDDLILYPAIRSSYLCSRCGAITNFAGDDPYCADCNWDSLTDPTRGNTRCSV